MTRTRGREKGAALIVVLFLVVTLSFLALSLSTLMAASAERSVASRAYHEAAWRLHGLEALTRVAVEQAIAAEEGKLTRANPLFAQVYTLPMDDAVGRVGFADDTRCLNVNSFATAEAGRSRIDERARAELLAFAGPLGASPGEVDRLIAAVADWTDADDFQEPGGAEDSFYTALPAPYRTGGAPLAAVSELRAVAGVDRTVFARLSPVLCARAERTPTSVNVNMLSTEDAPFLAAILGEPASLADAQDVIAAIPPEGFASIDQFWALPRIVDLPGAGDRRTRLQGRLMVTSQYLAARGVIEGSLTATEMTLILRITGGRAEVVSRRIGRPA